MIQFIWGDLSEAIEALRPHRPALLIADPNWTYSNSGGTSRKFRGTSSQMYGAMGMAEIAGILDRAWDVAVPGTYLVLWATNPLLFEVCAAMRDTRWRYLTAGNWHKLRRGIGVGFHVRSEVEPWLLFGKGSCRPRIKRLLSYQAAPAADRTEKPVSVISEFVRCLTGPGDTVGSLWTGRGPELRAAAALGRSAIGAEIDRWAWAQGIVRLEGAGAPPAALEPWLRAWAEASLAGRFAVPQALRDVAGSEGVEELLRRGALQKLDNGRLSLVRCPPRWVRSDKEG